MNKTSIVHNYSLYSAIIGVLILLMCGWFSHFTYKTHHQERNLSAIAEAQSIEHVFVNKLYVISSYMKSIGKLITNGNPKDPKHIRDILVQFNNQAEIESIASVTGFDWINTQNMITVNSNNGILKHPVDVSMRSFIQPVKENYNEIFLSPASFGRISAQWIIPTAMGFSDTRTNHYAGAISLGISVELLQERIQQLLINHHIKYAILDQDMNIVLGASEQDKASMHHFFKQHKTALETAIQSEEYVLESPITTDDGVVFSTVFSMEKFPYIIVVGYPKDVYFDEIWQKTYPSIIALVIIGTLCLLIIRRFAKNIISPIVDLSNAADRISRGEKNVEFPKNSPKEIHNLSIQISKINRYINRIKRIKKANEEAEMLKEKAIKANQAKTDLLALVSHELRTPLNAIINFSEIQKNELFGPMNNRKYHEYACDIHSSGVHLLQLINNILDITKAEANKIELIESDVCVEEIVQICKRTLSEHAAKENITITYQQQEGLPLLYADELCMKQIMINLMSNAVNYSQFGGKVSISAELSSTKDQEKQLVIIVEDTGIGIAEKDINRVMERFTQANNTSHKHKGTGLGLPLTRALVELHQGELKLESSLGEGTRVLISFPATRILMAPSNKKTASNNKNYIDPLLTVEA